MGVTTTADTHIDSARSKIEEATACAENAADSLRQAVNKETWGSTGFSQEYRVALHAAILELARVENLLRTLRDEV